MTLYNLNIKQRNKKSKTRLLRKTYHNTHPHIYSLTLILDEHASQLKLLSNQAQYTVAMEGSKVSLIKKTKKKTLFNSPFEEFDLCAIHIFIYLLYVKQ